MMKRINVSNSLGETAMEFMMFEILLEQNLKYADVGRLFREFLFE